MRDLIGDLNKTIQKRYTCGHCGGNIVSNDGVTYPGYSIYICHNCDLPTIFKYTSSDPIQIPGVLYGENILYLPKYIVEVYEEARKCFSVDAFTSSILCCRKILMNCATEKGAEPGKSFKYYIDYLQNKGYIPPHIKGCVDKIRTLGNESTHEIECKSSNDAKLALDFTGALLKIMYEMPGKLEVIDKETT